MYPVRELRRPHGGHVHLPKKVMKPCSDENRKVQTVCLYMWTISSLHWLYNLNWTGCLVRTPERPDLPPHVTVCIPPLFERQSIIRLSRWADVRPLCSFIELFNVVQCHRRPDSAARCLVCSRQPAGYLVILIWSSYARTVLRRFQCAIYGDIIFTAASGSNRRRGPLD